ncbi:MAG: Gfo/Idh/MocA family oxidoreductase [Saprospiraceae bacterium]|nr:Gfo/Idh/MocA family oxidoreductase [Saprospiraceae bacterium]
MPDTLQLGLIGLGHLGKIHLKCLLQIPSIKLVGCYELDPEIVKQVSEEYKVKFFSDLGELLRQCNAVDIVTPTSTHFTIAQQAMSLGKHCFIEKPVTQNLKEAYSLEILQKEQGVKIQIGHVERYNPAFSAVLPFVKNARFIEAHRLSSFNPRGTDVSVIHDLMIHDLDLISLLAQSEPVEIRANGVNIVSKHPDICSARIEFQSGLVANVTASRISMKQMRKFRIIQEDAYISLDLASKEAQVIRLLDGYEDNTIELDTFKGKKFVKLEDLKIQSNNAIVDELTSFAKSILEDKPCDVSLQDGIRALGLVENINKQMSRYL